MLIEGTAQMHHGRGAFQLWAAEQLIAAERTQHGCHRELWCYSQVLPAAEFERYAVKLLDRR